jgi:anaphase-promoting complex subunit 7
MTLLTMLQRAKRIDVWASPLSTLMRANTGGKLGNVGRRPEQHLILYQREGCPRSRKVREALSMLDLDAEIRPCPKGGTRFMSELERRSGARRIPFLVDPNTERSMDESDQIVSYLFETYGTSPPPLSLRLGPVTNLTSRLASLVRGGTGPRAVASLTPAIPLELWSYETALECRRAREALDAHELAYTLYNVPKGSPKRNKLLAISGGERVPYLVDPNRGLHAVGSDAILRHLERTYARETRRMTSYRSLMRLTDAEAT